LHEPALLIFDEPFSGFDPINANLLKNEILDLKQKGYTIIFSTHNMSSVEEICDDIALINRSKVILKGQVDEVRRRYKSHEFDLELHGNWDAVQTSLHAHFEILNVRQSSHSLKARIRMINGKNSNDLLSCVLPHASVYSFSEVVPSMNDIFIKAVAENSAS
jgi:ABC-2 type transport system ATP-binding protein